MSDKGNIRQYEKDHCWQYDIRLRNLQEDLKDAGITEEKAKTLLVSDFRFTTIDSETGRREAVDFIKRHEWLGNLSQFTTHWFGAYYDNPEQGLYGKPTLAGVILMNMPNAFSKLMGEDTPKLERLISRGACVSWSPKCLASSFMMWSIRWMVKNTQYRIFTAYSDPMAKELGTIYQACNFYYIGDKSGTTTRCINPYTGKMVSDRFFRQRTAYKKFAKELGIEWDRSWCDHKGMLWENVPKEVEKLLRDHSKMKYNQAEKIEMPLKHKYAFVLGATASETKRLRREFEERNRKVIKPYPKVRGK